jgi:alpha-beta hydrolase superfamily lysophospholipase
MNWPLRGAALALALLLLAGFSGCTAARPPASTASAAPLGQASFDAYRRETVEWLRQQRNFQTTDRDSELAWNAPAEWRPAGQAQKGILLIHGLGDSPWSFVDIGERLAAQGFLVRTVLLPGHGSKPADLLDVDIGDWRRLVKEQVALLQKEVPQVMLGGFSTGANLALDHALDNPAIDGLLLFSPALKSGVPGEALLPWLAKVRPWLREPAGTQPQQTALRYLNVPTNGFAQYARTGASVRQKMAQKTWDKPALLVLAEHDSVVDVEYVLRAFERRFTHPASRVIWYGERSQRQRADSRLLVRTDRLPEAHISEFSHMGVLFAPGNPLYGSAGSQKLCWNGQSEEKQRACMAGAPVWYSEWGHQEEGKIHARLSFNPYFDWQAGVMREVLGHVD